MYVRAADNETTTAPGMIPTRQLTEVVNPLSNADRGVIDAISRGTLPDAGMTFEIPKLYRFIKDHPNRAAVPPEKLTKLLKVVLEALHPSESELLLKLMKKNLGVKGLTVKIVQDAISGK